MFLRLTLTLVSMWLPPLFMQGFPVLVSVSVSYTLILMRQSPILLSSITMTRKTPDFPPGTSFEVVESYYTMFDSECMELISDLGLVKIGSPAMVEHINALRLSRYSKYWFCERVLDQQRVKELDRSRLLSDICKRNRKYSRYVYQSLSRQEDIRWSEYVLHCPLW